MKQFSEIVEVIKDIISEEINGKVLDKHVAKILSVSPGMLATNKSRNIILFEQLAQFCALKRIALNSILFDQAVESLIDNTNRLYANRYSISEAV